MPYFLVYYKTKTEVNILRQNIGKDGKQVKSKKPNENK